MEKLIRILIADDHNLFRSGVRRLFEEYEYIDIVGEAKDGEELVKKYIEHKPDVVLADIAMPKLSGFEAFKQIKNYDPDVKFLFLSMHETPEYIHYSRKIGARGLIGKSMNQSELIDSIQKVASGEECYGTEWTKKKLDELDAKYTNLADGVINLNISFTSKEKEVLVYVAEGFTSDEIAERMNLGKRTIDTHRSKIMKKINAATLSQLIAFSIKYCTVNNLGVDTNINPSK